MLLLIFVSGAGEAASSCRMLPRDTSSCRTFPARPFLLADCTFVDRQSSFRCGISSCRISRSSCPAPLRTLARGFAGCGGGKQMVRGMVAGVAANLSVILGSHAKKKKPTSNRLARTGVYFLQTLSSPQLVFFAAGRGLFDPCGPAMRSDTPAKFAWSAGIFVAFLTRRCQCLP